MADKKIQFSDLIDKLNELSLLYEKYNNQTFDDVNEDEEDRNYDNMSNEKIWRNETKIVSIYSYNIFDFIEQVKFVIDDIIKAHPTLSYEDISVKTDYTKSYEDTFGVINIEFEWLESDNEYKMRQMYKDNAQEFILNKYNWDDVVDKTLKLYEKK